MQVLLTQPGNPSLEFMEGLYSDYVRDPESVPAEWRKYFGSLKNGDGRADRNRFEPSFPPASIFHAPADRSRGPAGDEDARLHEAVNRLVHNYRVRGHRIARIDPLEQPRPRPPELDPAFCGITESDLDRRVSGECLGWGGWLTVREVWRRLRETYCRSIGVQYMHISDVALRKWLQERMERTQNRLALTRQEQWRILTRLTDAVTFELFLRKKFIGAKSFSLEGCESLIPLLDMVLERAGEQEVSEIVMGMAHRGRLNVLANILGKSPRQIFREFGAAGPEPQAPGDVKYHLGYSGEWKTSRGQSIHVSLCFNPSHLEFVNPVVLGRARAKQDRAGDLERRRCLALLIHGDASLAGEGIVQETLNLTALPGYTTGGVLHIVVNNQIGFTTSPAEGRSTEYATDAARMLHAPVFHVNGEDPEAVTQAVRLAMDFRDEFQRDVFIDMYGYRRLGHNETDEPSFTQPVLYRAIARRKSVREGYLDHLLKLGAIRRDEAEGIAKDRLEVLESQLSEAHSPAEEPAGPKPGGVWQGYLGGPEREAPEVATGLERGRLAELLEKQTHFPRDFRPHPKIEKAVEIRRAMARGERMLDWSAAESLALGSLAAEGFRVRLSGQDSARGTFSQRHDVVYDYEDGHPYTPLQHLAEGQGSVEICNSPLSEAGVLGFEYGYSLDCPDGLIVWEAQFGDFVNAAQVVVDQFLASAEEKWGRLSGLVLLLPHGLEGMGPEHSSARLERFLSLAAGDNLQIVSPTTPAQYFHCLRRQVLRRWRKPLVVMTPKGLLRHPAVASRLEECASGHFQRVLPDARSIDNAARLLLCSGKIFYELEAFREKGGAGDAALARIEQLYPFPEEALREVLRHCRDGTPVVWVQEEPRNMGAWGYLREKFGEKLFGRFPLSVVSRPERASPATGSANRHQQEQEQLVARAFAAENSKLKDNRKEYYEKFFQRPHPWPHFRRHRLLVYPEQGTGTS